MRNSSLPTFKLEPAIVYVFITCILVVSVSLLFFLHKVDLIPATIFTFLATLFAYTGLYYTKEKFRLDLYEKRFEIYCKTLDFCSLIMTHGGMPRERHQEHIDNAVLAAKGSFAGIGYHQTRALFGSDIADLFEKLNRTYAWLSTYDEPLDLDHHVWAKRKHDSILFIWETVEKLPEIFKPYVYFGNYRT
jgi:hypothetical protein